MTVGPIPEDQIETAAAEIDPPRRRPVVDFVRRPLPMQVLRFSAVGIICTTTYAVLYLTLHSIAGAQVANFVAMLISAILNTALNRAFTFRLRGSRKIVIHHVQGIAVFGFGWALTALSLFVFHEFADSPSSQIELVILMVVNLIATCVRFVTFRQMFARALAKQLAGRHS